MYAYHGRMLVVNLSDRTTEVRELYPSLLAKFVGGKGLGAKLLYDLLPPGLGPLSEANYLLFVTGPLVGTRAPTSCRVALVTKSPLTGIFLDSYASEKFGPYLKGCGYDVLAITGRSPSPVYLSVFGEKLAFHEAEDLWGLGCYATESVLRSRHPGAAVACIGPAGENGALIAGVYTEGRWAARGGGGTVLGAKGVKALVVAGTDHPPLADPERFTAAVRDSHARIQAHPVVRRGGVLQTLGTPNLVLVLNEFGILPTHNWQQNTFSGAQGISGEVMRDRVVKGLAPCHGCPIACGKESEVRDGPFAGTWVRGPELETVYALGSVVGVDQIEEIVYLNRLCNDLGLDTISAGVIVAFAIEAFQKGIIGRSDTGGLQLEFGDVQAIAALLEKIAYRRDVGELLSQGTRKAAQTLGRGSESFAMHTKGLELPAYDPRGMKGMGLAYATSDRGGCHLRASTLNIEVRGLGQKVDRYAEQGKARFVKAIQDAWAVIDSMIYCKFAGYAVDLGAAAQMYSAATGVEVTPEDLETVGERIFNLTRLFNCREGVKRPDDTLPRRLLEEPVREGPSSGEVVDLEPMLEEYYRLRGWDENGVPTAGRLLSLGLDQEARALDGTQ